MLCASEPCDGFSTMAPRVSFSLWSTPNHSAWVHSMDIHVDNHVIRTLWWNGCHWPEGGRLWQYGQSNVAWHSVLCLSLCAAVDSASCVSFLLRERIPRAPSSFPLWALSISATSSHFSPDCIHIFADESLHSHYLPSDHTSLLFATFPHPALQ